MKNKSKFFLAILIFILVISITFFIRIKPINSNVISPLPEVKNNSENIITSNSKNISLNELSKHNSASDCWISYKNKVYDITSYLSRHPGSPEKIIPYCGTSTEFENAFTKKHGTSKVSLLMKIGTFIGDFDVI